MKRSDYAMLCDHAYRVDCLEDAWLDGLARAAMRACGDLALGVVACTFRPSALTERRVLHKIAVVGGPASWGEHLKRELEALTPRHRAALFPRAPLSCRASELLTFFGLTDYASVDLLPTDNEDAWVVSGQTEPGHGALMVLPIRPGREAEFDADSWQRFSVHLAEAARLRGLVHAYASWRHHALKVSSLHRQLSAAPQSDETAALWRGLLEGRYTIMERHDGLEHVHLVLHLTPPDPQPPRQLTEREREVVTYAALGHDNATIAFELGITAPTVATHLSSALQRLNVANRSQLIVLYHQLAS